MVNAGNTVLITGGSAGIGLALASRLLEAGNEVVICGRRQDRLDEARQRHPALHVYRCDLAVESERIDLYRRVVRDFPRLNVLLNNAGTQRRIRLDAPGPWEETNREIETNLSATIHLTELFVEHLSRQEVPVIVVTTSGLAYVPRAFAPVYCATKAALHSFALSLRYQLKPRNIEVVEVCPPHVDTDLGGAGTNTAGIGVDTFADAVMVELARGNVEITFGFSTRLAHASRAERDELFNSMNPDR
jgi:uncharacterized oxidoreductase